MESYSLCLFPPPLQGSRLPSSWAIHVFHDPPHALCPIRDPTPRRNTCSCRPRQVLSCLPNSDRCAAAIAWGFFPDAAALLCRPWSLCKGGSECEGFWC